MSNLKGPSAGGKANALIQRKDALDRYYASPNYCLGCNQIIRVPEGSKVAVIRKKHFCNQSCSATYHNKKRCLAFDPCTRCGSPIPRTKTPKGKSNKRKVCDDCSASQLTKREVFARHSLHSAHSLIREYARTTFVRFYGKKKPCQVCGYDRHTEICHLQEIKDFPDETKLTEINALENLVCLCPNHHWEMDHGFLPALKTR